MRDFKHSSLKLFIGLAIFAQILFVSSCSPKLQLAESQKTLYPIFDTQVKDQRIVDFYRPYKLEIDSLMKEVIAVSDFEIVRGRPEGPLNNLFADALSEAGKSRNIQFDLAYTNYGGLRLPLPKGDIALYRVFELMPFENIITTVKFKGEDMEAFFNYMASMGGDPISGATYRIKDNLAKDIIINGKALDSNRDYTVLTSDYMANGGDGGVIFLKSTERKEYNVKLRDAIIEYLRKRTKEGKTINPRNDGRITVE